MIILALSVFFLGGFLIGFKISNQQYRKTIKNLEAEVRFEKHANRQIKLDIITWHNCGRYDLINKLIDSMKQEVK